MSDIHHFATEYPRADASKFGLGRKTYHRFGKRAFDLTFALILLPVLGLAILLFTTMARLDGGPGLFSHTRIGRNGGSFRCWKIRTMVPDAEARLKQHLATDKEAAQEWQQNYKLVKDPRITKLGSFLRRSGLDEMPQIWNILKGEMSFVGPRPVTKPELAKYGSDKSVYLKMRPGVTGMWQIHGRNSGSYPTRIRYDRSYLDAMSLRSDLSLIFKTALSISRMTGQ